MTDQTTTACPAWCEGEHTDVSNSYTPDHRGHRRPIGQVGAVRVDLAAVTGPGFDLMTREGYVSLRVGRGVPLSLDHAKASELAGLLTSAARATDPSWRRGHALVEEQERRARQLAAEHPDAAHPWWCRPTETNCYEGDGSGERQHTSEPWVVVPCGGARPLSVDVTLCEGDAGADVCLEAGDVVAPAVAREYAVAILRACDVAEGRATSRQG